MVTRLGIRHAVLLGVATALTSFPMYLPAEEARVSNISYNSSEDIDYTKIRERTAKKLGNETVKVEFGLESKLWEGLKVGKSKKEFYDSIKESPVELKTTTIFAGISGIRGYINNDDISQEFLSAADRFIQNPAPDYDPTLTFSSSDKKILEKMLERELRSSIRGKIGSWNPFGDSKEVYLYPPKSKIFLRTDREGNAYFEMVINTNSDTSLEPIYKKLDASKITDKVEKEVFRKFLLLSILTKDPDGIVPFENFYIEYQKRKI